MNRGEVKWQAWYECEIVAVLLGGKLVNAIFFYLWQICNAITRLSTDVKSGLDSQLLQTFFAHYSV